MRRAAPIALLLLVLGAARADAVTVKDIIDLTRAGLGEEVLLALIEVDGGVFSIDAATLTELKRSGVSERVIEAMVRSGRMRPAEPPPPPPVYYEPEPPQPPQPQVIVIEHERPVVEQVAVPYPVFVLPQNIHPRGKRTQIIGDQPLDPSPGFGAPTPPTSRPKAHRPVYWGWGGKLRPDAWKPK
jgi:hypothetical protein